MSSSSEEFCVDLPCPYRVEFFSLVDDERLTCTPHHPVDSVPLLHIARCDMMNVGSIVELLLCARSEASVGVRLTANDFFYSFNDGFIGVVVASDTF